MGTPMIVSTSNFAAVGVGVTLGCVWLAAKCTTGKNAAAKKIFLSLERFTGQECKRDAPIFNGLYPDRAIFMKMKMWETMIKGTRNVGNRLSGNSRNGDIEIQSRRPTRKASTTTSKISSRPHMFHMRRRALPFGCRQKIRRRSAPAATMQSPKPAGRANAGFNSPRWARIKK